MVALTDDDGDPNTTDPKLLDISRDSNSGLIDQETFAAPSAADSIVSTYTYDGFGRPETATHKIASSGTILAEVDITARDDAGRIESLEETINGSGTEYLFE